MVQTLKDVCWCNFSTTKKWYQKSMRNISLNGARFKMRLSQMNSLKNKLRIFVLLPKKKRCNNTKYMWLLIAHSCATIYSHLTKRWRKDLHQKIYLKKISSFLLKRMRKYAVQRESVNHGQKLNQILFALVELENFLN